MPALQVPATDDDDRPRSSARALRVAVAVAILMAPFLLVLDAFFVSDDLQMWLFGATVPPGEIAWLPSSRWTWHRPLPAFSWIVNHRLGGDHVAWWHLPNVVLHATSTVLAWQLAVRLSRSRAVALLTAVLFAWSPAAPGTVNWISARPDLLVTMWSLAAMVIAYSPRLLARPGLQTGLVAACVLLAVSSKESAFGLLPIVVFLAVGPRVLPHVPAHWQLPARLASVVVLILGAYLVMRVGLYGPTLGGYGTPLSVRRLVTAPLLAMASVFAPLRLLAWWSAGWSGVAGLACGLALTALGLWRAPMWTLAALGAVLPAAHIISASSPAWEYDRFHYLTSFWAAGGASTLIVELASRRWRLAVTVAGLLVVADAVYLGLRVQGARAAAAIVADADRTLRAARAELPTGSVVSCARLPDNLHESYVYRNGCEEHVQLIWPGRDVSGTRSGTLPPGAPVFELSPDGRSLRPRAAGTSTDPQPTPR